MTYKIGVYGSSVIEDQRAVQSAQELGQVLAQNKVIVITGGRSGMPSLVAQATKQQGGEVWGFTPARNASEQQRRYPSDEISLYDKLFFIPPDYDRAFYLEKLPAPDQDESTRLKYRNVLSTTHVDAGIIVAGGWGTMNEFTDLLYDGKPIGVLLGTGGLADELPEWYPRLRKKSKSIVYFHSSPSDLVIALLQGL
jgi:predicted Rossmann-fold nucleotide-binding protein